MAVVSRQTPTGGGLRLPKGQPCFLWCSLVQFAARRAHAVARLSNETNKSSLRSVWVGVSPAQPGFGSLLAFPGLAPGWAVRSETSTAVMEFLHCSVDAMLNGYDYRLGAICHI